MTSMQTLNFEVLDKETTKIIGNTTLTVRVQEQGANYLVHKALTNQSLNRRNFTAATKTRADVRGGGRKPWKQKGTGRARAGSNRSPLWKGGGVTFGPKPKKVYYKLNRKERQLAIQTLICNKQKQILALTNLTLTEQKTKKITELIQRFNVDLNKQTLIVTSQFDKTLLKAVRNLPHVNTVQFNHINLEKLIHANTIIIEAKAIEQMGELYARK
uniref:Large ribosomal subunit protein uL4c n=1 Tax=Rhizochromulina marina TaxID=1034831 RepID=A0A514CPW1_9STRA|nr:ribosomal protein L4 [Rhizochromulina marina]QDH81840.1 ribosomal protein L4 [Rhizochromulina marina]